MGSLGFAYVSANLTHVRLLGGNEGLVMKGKGITCRALDI